jgi:excisionase family DNA binding protein
METFEDLLKTIVTDAVREAIRQELGRPGSTSEIRYLSAREAADLVGVTPATIREWTGTGLRRCGTGRVLRIRSDELHDFMAAPRHSGDDKTPEQRAAEMVPLFRKQAAQRCAACHRLPALHITFRGCRAKKCTCKAFVPQGGAAHAKARSAGRVIRGGIGRPTFAVAPV